MKRIISAVLTILIVSINASAQKKLVQDKELTLKIMDLTPGGVTISGKEKKKYECFKSNEPIEWLKQDAYIVIKIPEDITDIDLEGNYITLLYAGETPRLCAKDIKDDNNWFWIFVKGTISKGTIVKNITQYFSRVFDMYEDELIIVLPEVLAEGAWYIFESLENGKSFYCLKEDQKPLIKITREMLDSIDFNGKQIKLRVWYKNGYNPRKAITDCMIINYND